MEPLNYCRQLAARAKQMLGMQDLKRDDRAAWTLVQNLCRASAKFALPEGGYIVEDWDLRGLDGGVKLCLPYKTIALEWHVGQEPEPGTIKCSKRIVFAMEQDDSINCWTAIYVDSADIWRPWFSFWIPRDSYLTRKNGELCILVGAASETAKDEVAHEADRLISFLNALECSNVGIESMPPRKVKKKAKDALPFDTYHVLVINQRGQSAANDAKHGAHRSPREHLRRGHIRRLHDGRKIWINATVVAAGRGAGVVTKDYAFQKAA